MDLSALIDLQNWADEMNIISIDVNPEEVSLHVFDYTDLWYLLNSWYIKEDMIEVEVRLRQNSIHNKYTFRVEGTIFIITVVNQVRR